MDKLGIDRTSAGEFMQLIGAEDTARGLTDKGEYNAFLILVEPSDKLASLVLRIASGTQVLNYVMGVLMGAPGFLPNMYAGNPARGGAKAAFTYYCCCDSYCARY